MRDEAVLRAPAVGDRRPAVQGPAPVGSTVELVGQTSYLGFLLAVAVEIGRTGEHAREEKGRVDGRQLAVPHAPTGLHVEEVIVEALVAGRVRLGSVRAVAEEAEPSQGDRWREFPCDHASLDEDRKGGQRQADRRDAGRRGLLGLVADETVLRVGLVEVVLQRRQLEPIQVLLGQHVDGVVLGHCDQPGGASRTVARVSRAISSPSSVRTTTHIVAPGLPTSAAPACAHVCLPVKMRPSRGSAVASGRGETRPLGESRHQLDRPFGVRFGRHRFLTDETERWFCSDADGMAVLVRQRVVGPRDRPDGVCAHLVSPCTVVLKDAHLRRSSLGAARRRPDPSSAE